MMKVVLLAAGLCAFWLTAAAQPAGVCDPAQTGATSPNAVPDEWIPSRLAQVRASLMRGLITPEGVGPRLCSGRPELQSLCMTWKEELLAIAHAPADWSGMPKVERELRRMVDMLFGAWADDAAMQRAFIDALAGTPLRSLGEYAMAKESLERFRTHPWPLAFTAMDGSEVDLSHMRGTPVVVVFWSMRCVGCRRQIPKLKALYDKYHAQGLQIVGTTSDRDRERLEAFIAKEGMAWPQRQEREQHLADFETFGFEWVSNLLLFDKDGLLLRAQPSPALADWEALIQSELGLPAT